MSRFDSAAYDKLFPQVEEVPEPETVVPTFTPTKDKLEHPEHKPESSVPDVDDPGDPDDSDLDEKEVLLDGDGEHSKSDIEQ